MDKVENIKREHVGRWIGVKDDELVAVSDSHRGLYKRLKEKGISGVYIFYSPTEEEKRYGFLTKILLWGAPLTKNLGGPSLFLSARKILSTYIPNAEFTLLSCHPDRDLKKAREYGVKLVGLSTRELVKAFVRALLWTTLKKVWLSIPSLLNNKLLKEYRDADIFIDIWGISFTDFFPSWIENIMSGIPLLIGKLLKKPVVKFTQDMGPFKKSSTRFPAKIFLSRVDLIIARSVATQNYLRDIGITRHVHVRPDSAFVLQPVSTERVSEIMIQEKLDKRPLICVSITTQIDRRLSRGDIEAQNKYTIVMAQIVDYLIKTLDAIVVFIPNETHGGYDDNYVISKVYKRIKNKSSIRWITNEYGAEELKGIIGACDIHIGSRYHSIVASISMCVPTLVIGWGYKYKQLMEMVGKEEFVCDFKTVTFDELREKVDNLWLNRKKIRAELASQLPYIKESVLSGGKLVKELLNARFTGRV